MTLRCNQLLQKLTGLSCLALAWGAVNFPASAQIPITTNGSPFETFTIFPGVTNWSTKSLPGAADQPESDAALDQFIQGHTNAASTINTSLSNRVGDPPGTLATAQWTSSGYVVTRPTSSAVTLLMATLTNVTGGNINRFFVKYDYKQNATSVANEVIKGHRVYYNLTGATNKWVPLGDFGNSFTSNLVQAISIEVEISATPWAAGTAMYLLFADDNSVINPDGANNIDNFRVTNVVAISAPVIVTQPQDSSVALAGSVSFSVTAIGEAPLTYYWRKNGSVLSVGSSPSYTINNAAVGDAGNYSVIVSNAFGSVTSSVATLTVVSCPAIVLSPATLPGGTNGLAYNQTITASGGASPYTYAVTVGSLPAGLSLSSGGVLSGTPSVAETNNLTVTATDTNGCIGSQAYTFVVSPSTGTVPSISSQPQSATNLPGATASFSLTATGTAPLAYQWRFNGTNLFDTIRITGSQGTNLTIGGLAVSDAGAYVVVVTNLYGAVTSSVATLSLSAQVVLSLDVDERGLPITNTYPGFSSFIITSNISATTGQTTPTTRSIGGITVTLGGVGNPTYDDRVRTVPTNDLVAAPGFTQEQLLRDFVFQSSSTNGDGLSVTIDGLTASQYYKVTVWSFDNGSPGNRVSDWTANGVLVKAGYTFNGSVLPTTDAQYQFNFKTAADGMGRILIQGRRTAATATAGGVFLNAMQVEATTPDPPVVTVNPYGSTVYAGDNPTAMSVQVSGVAPFAYEWRRDGASLPNATNSSLLLSNAQPADVGSYDCVISSAFGSITSSVAALVVLPVTSIESGRISYWPLDMVVASPPELLSPDAAASANHLYLTNLDGSNLGAGFRTNSLMFNGTNSVAVRVHTNSTGLPICSYPAYSIAMWVKGNFTNQNDRRVFSESSTTNNNVLVTIGTDNAATNSTVDIFVRNNDGTTTINHRKSLRPAFDGNWHHIAWVDNNGAARLYVDGMVESVDFSYLRGALTPNITSLGGILRATNAGNWYAGQIDDVVLYRRALTATEVQTVMLCGPMSSGVPASISLSPASRTNFAGTSTVLSVTASGATPLTYQWYFGSNPIPSATNANLALNSLTMADTGDYTVSAANCFGSVTSSVATLTVVSCPVIVLSPATLPGGTNGLAYNQTITASGGAAPYSFGVTAGSLPAGLSLSSNGVLSGTPSAGGSYNFTVTASDTNWCAGGMACSLAVAGFVLPFTNGGFENGLSGWAVGGSRTITSSTTNPPTIPDGSGDTGFFTNRSVMPGSPAGPAADVLPVEGASFALISTAFTNRTATRISQTFLVPSNPGLLSFNYRLMTDEMDTGTNFNDVFQAYLNSNVIARITRDDLQPRGIGGSNALTLVATQGVGSFRIGTAWRSAWVDLAAYSGQAVTLSFVVWDVGDAVVDSAVALDKVVLGGEAPAITSHPQSRTNVAGTTASFSVSASGTQPLSYQWQFNGTNLVDTARIHGSQTNVLTIAAVALGDIGNYKVVVSTGCGTLTSSVARLSMVLPPLSPSLFGSSNVLSLVWSAAAGLTYQVQGKTNLSQPNWLNLGAPITATNGAVTFLDSMTNSERYYRVILQP